MKEPLKVASLMSDNEDFIFNAIIQYIQKQMVIPVRVVNQIPWKERERLLDASQIDIAWICGFPYILRADKPDSGIELLAAPVMLGKRYQNQPIYFSDVIVHKDSRFQKFTDLKRASWAYNEPFSHSGYNVVRYHLATLGEKGKYFGKVVESGAHLTSLEMVLRHQVDASAIDSIVLEIEFQRHPDIRSELRIIETLGPSPIPPLVVSIKLALRKRELLRDLLINMNTDPSGQEALAQAGLGRLTLVRDSDYDSIRDTYRIGKDIILT